MIKDLTLRIALISKLFLAGAHIENEELLRVETVFSRSLSYQSETQRRVFPESLFCVEPLMHIVFLDQHQHVANKETGSFIGQTPFSKRYPKNCVTWLQSPCWSWYSCLLNPYVVEIRRFSVGRKKTILALLLPCGNRHLGFTDFDYVIPSPTRRESVKYQAIDSMVWWL